MILGESVNTAIVKMKDSYNAYRWILANKNLAEKEIENYKSYFSEAQQIFSAVDILLRCFIIEKKIPIFRGNKEVFVTEETDNLFVTTTEFCCAILAYNKENPDKQWLKEVDFDYFIEDNKEPRNENEHLGITGELQDLYRVYYNLNMICKELDATEFSLSLEMNEERFDYAQFDACMDEMNVEDRRYILLADSMHNVNKEYLETFLQIPWSVIFDFDDASSMGGLQSVFENENYKGSFYSSYFYSEFTANSNIQFTCAHIALGENDFKKRFRTKKQDDNDNIRIPVIMDAIRDSIHNKATIVVTGLQTERVRDICKLIKSKFLETDIIFLTNQKSIRLLERTADDEWEETGNIAAVTSFDYSVFEVMRSIFENREIFLKKALQEKIEKRDSYIFKGLDGTTLYVNDMDLLRSKEPFFEFLHLDISNDMTQCNEWEFYHGDIVKWETIQGGYVEPLIDGDKLKAFEEEIKSNQSSSCFTIYHLPGFGGTTLGRLVAWNLHKDMPVVCLKGYDTIQKLTKDIGDIYTHLFAKHKFLLLIDENDFSVKQMQELEKMIMDSEYLVKALFVKRINESDVKRRQKQRNNRQKNEIIFSVLEVKYKNALKQKCYNLLKSRGQEVCYNKREEHMNHTLVERHKCALIINLYLLEENFNLKNYVKKFLDKVAKDSDGEKERKVFLFIAMGDFFSSLKLPAAYIARYLDSSGKLKPRNIEERLGNYSGLFLKTQIQETGSIAYGIKHYLIAQEMLQQILTDDKNESWQAKLPEVVMEFIDFLYQLIQGMDKIDEPVKNIVSWLFTDKTKSRWLVANDDAYEENSFTSLLMSLNEYRRLDVIDHLADQFGDFIKSVIPKKKLRMEYKLLAHIYAQRAKIRLKSQRINETEESQEEEIQRYMQETMDVIVAENICEYDLEHMLGMCYLEKVKKMKEEEKWTEELYEEILDNTEKAIERFDYTIWYGSPDYGIPCKINAITMAIEAIIKYHNIKPDKRIEKLYEMPEAEEYVDSGIKAIQDMDEYQLAFKSRTIAEKRRDEFERVCFPDKTSDFLQRLNNLEDKISDSDYEGHYFVSAMTVYAYEKKHYLEDYRRGSLIHKALSKNADAIKDAERVFEHLDRMVKMNQEHPVSYTTYNLWFEYAKYMQISLARAYEQACNWKQAEIMREKTAEHRNSLIRPCYYLFVIQLLRYCEGENISEKELLDRKQDLGRQISSSRANEVVQDWYSNRKGLGRLYSREWTDVKNVDMVRDIAEVQGKVVYVEEQKCNYGYLRITSLNAINKWSKAPKGMRYNKDSDVYFSQKQNNIITERDINKAKKFKFGFAYEKLSASMNSLENRNIAKTVVETGEE